MSMESSKFKERDYFTFASALVGLVNRLDDTDGNGLSHVANGETTKRGVLVIRLNTLHGQE